MRKLVLTALSVAPLLLAVGALSPAAADNSRYCLQGTRWGYPGNCQFATYQQCAATASGTNDYCGINPRSAFREQRGYRSSYYR